MFYFLLYLLALDSRKPLFAISSIADMFLTIL